TSRLSVVCSNHLSYEPVARQESGLDLSRLNSKPGCAGLTLGRVPIWSTELPRKEVIQPQVPLRLPCYDFTPVSNQTLDAYALAVGPAASGPVQSHGVTGGVYKARERIHRGMLIRDY